SGLTALVLFALLAPAPSSSLPSRQTVSFTLHKFLQPIGIENTTIVHDGDGTTEIRVASNFTDRGTSVPLAALLKLSPKGSPVRFQLWGSTARGNRIDDRVVVQGRVLRVEQMGEQQSLETPQAFFTVSAYAPVSITEQLVKYWIANGRPASLPVFPA